MTKEDRRELSQHEAGEHLGVSEPTLIKYRVEGAVKAVRRGKRWMYDVASLDRVKAQRDENPRGIAATAGARRVADALGSARRAILASEEGFWKHVAAAKAAEAAGEPVAPLLAELIKALKADTLAIHDLLGEARRELGAATIVENHRERLGQELAFVEGIQGRRDEAFDHMLDDVLAVTRGGAPRRRLDWRRYAALAPAASVRAE
jgi:hypothetical protein